MILTDKLKAEIIREIRVCSAKELESYFTFLPEFIIEIRNKCKENASRLERRRNMVALNENIIETHVINEGLHEIFEDYEICLFTLNEVENEMSRRRL
ncbi:hypothetical protein OKW21_006071 [Catalinimonas alkaloidigena]|uniref:hypothetical protein n=1 Tax=Catalinimonas alkaloidigena TaxID=1075417 RepID=UPI0024063A93|nr:hypothetical protein [Catalinimonas alkaloidigena]MDF9800808.1 hypothetical protein [Catalinimonas alkaloidigena]